MPLPGRAAGSAETISLSDLLIKAPGHCTFLKPGEDNCFGPQKVENHVGPGFSSAGFMFGVHSLKTANELILEYVGL